MKRAINKNKVFYLTVSVLAVLVIIAGGVKVFFDFFVSDERQVVSKTKLDSLEMYGYTLDEFLCISIK